MEQTSQGGSELDNRGKLTEALGDVEILPYAELRERSGVPVGSFDRVLNGALADGAVVRADGGYRLGDGSGEEGATGPGETRATSGLRFYCHACGGSHEKRPGGGWACTAAS
jgi:hypothetical protein